MKKILLSITLFIGLQADTITFINGAVVEGKISNRDKQVATIVVNGVSTTYSMSDIKNIQTISAPPPPPVAAMPAPLPKKSITPITLEKGSVIHAKTTTSLDSSKHTKGYQFTMLLESDLMSKDGRIFAKKGSTLYGVVVSSKQAGRLVGKSEMIITLTSIAIGSKHIDIKTQNINLVAAKSQGKDTTRKVIRGAAIGALINGNDGAKDGAKVGAGLAILTHGKSTGVPAATLLNFSLSSSTTLK